MNFRIAIFVNGFLLALLLGALVIWAKSTEALHAATHEWEAGDACSALEHLYAARPIHRKESSHLLGAQFATGQCVQQDLARAESYYAESGLVDQGKLAERLFYMAEAVLEINPGNLESNDVKGRVGSLAKRAKQLGFKPNLNTKLQISGKEKEFLFSLFNL